MSQGYNLKFDKMRENNPASNQDASSTEANAERYVTPGTTRNVCFVWPDGKRMFFNYAYLIAAEFDPTKETNEIRLEFSSHTVTMKGYGLEALFMDFLDHVSRTITARDLRFNISSKTNEPFVFKITISTN
ncbi:hypothetical protein [Dyadobacter sp. LHD-138]|uniref:hypothetical protein n=1 Tax=Dyadobacter sp. LHD-138 TaxID=3071413 RepID=UPI0027DF2DA6|nr:hypothetical protein [Dyadobacter sp. LHD-138]MDQ6482167.1 hypothetical protein [Dyadobacter sp. LHD-138]